MNSLERFLRIVVEDSNGNVNLHHEGLTENMLQIFKMTDCNPSASSMPLCTDLDLDETPFLSNIRAVTQLIASLFPISNTSRPDSAFAGIYLSKFIQKPIMSYMTYAKRRLRYPKGTPAFGLSYKRGGANSTWG